MKNSQNVVRSQVNIQPVFRLVDFFEETTEYERNWQLPFNSLALCVRDDPEDPSWIELPEKNCRIYYEANVPYFTTCDTPMRIRYTPANRHFCIHFRYELFPGVDLFSGIRERYILKDKQLPDKIKSVFSDPDPLRRLARAEAVTMAMLLDFWPKHLPLDLHKALDFGEFFQYVRKKLDCRIGIPEMAAIMGWSEAHFSRVFHSVFHITPKQYLVRELFARALGLLNDPGKSIKEISAELGFSSEFNFSRFIKQYSGQAPSQLRRTASGPLYVRK